HAVGQKRAARNRRALIRKRVNSRRERLHLLDRVRRLVHERSSGPFAEDEMRLDVGALQNLEQADAVDRPGRTGNRDDDAPSIGHDISYTRGAPAPLGGPGNATSSASTARPRA